MVTSIFSLRKSGLQWSSLKHFASERAKDLRTETRSERFRFLGRVQNFPGSIRLGQVAELTDMSGLRSTMDRRKNSGRLSHPQAIVLVSKTLG